MRRSIITVVFAMLVSVVCAQDLYVYSVIGQAEKQENGKWVALQKRNPLSKNDVIRVENNSAFSFIDRKGEKIYSIAQTNNQKISDVMATYKGKMYASNFVSHASKALFDGGSDKISHEAAGCTYRGDIIENDIAKSLLAKYKGQQLGSVDNVLTDYSVSFDLLDRETKEVITATVPMDKQAIFRVKNNSDVPLYVNVLDINKLGEKYVCLPIDDATTLSHLLIPANCTIDLISYPIEFTAPAGVDNFILIATEEPYDLRQVKKYLDKVDSTKPITSKCTIGVYSKNYNVK